MRNIPNYIRLAHDYMGYWFAAKSVAGHGIHSPLVYDFVRQVLYPKGKCGVLNEVDWYRSWQVSFPMSLQNSAFGAKRSDSNKPVKLGRLIKTSSVSSKTGCMLYRLAKWIDAETVLEFGTSVGISTIYLAAACPKASIYSMEGDKQRISMAKHSFDFLNFENITVLEGNFDTNLEPLIEKIPKLDLVFFDGNHKPEPTLRYFKRCLEKTHPNTVFVFDDIRWSNEMFKAWQVISQHKSVSVSIDLFNVGIVLFRNGIPKQHFAINY